MKATIIWLNVNNIMWLSVVSCNQSMSWSNKNMITRNVALLLKTLRVLMYSPAIQAMFMLTQEHKAKVNQNSLKKLSNIINFPVNTFSHAIFHVFSYTYCDDYIRVFLLTHSLFSACRHCDLCGVWFPVNVK